MICLDVDLNGAKVCRAGVGKHGLVQLNVGWHSLPPAWKSKGRRARTSRVDFGVAGVLYDPRPPGHENVWWADGHFAVGDELRIRVVESKSADEPLRRDRSEPVPQADQWDMISARIDGCVRDLRRLESAEAKKLARELLALTKKARTVSKPG